jgi:UDP-N-acetylmuramoylalanine--D-glutamate ligase
VIVVNEFLGKHVAVYGVGRTGASVIKSLKAGGASVVTWDDSEAGRAKAEELGTLVMHPSGWNWLSLEALILSPGIPLTHPEPHSVVVQAQHAGVEVIGDLELFARALKDSERNTTVIAVTGTNGKSTTTALIAHVLKRTGRTVQVGGNIGKPVLDLQPPQEGTYYVLEVSSYQADLIETLHPDLVVFLNLTSDHLERHGDMAGYMKAKKRLIERIPSGGKAIVGAGSRPTQELCTELTLTRKDALIPISADRVLGNGVFVVGGKLFDGTLPNAEEVADLKTIAALQGRHNWENAAAAYAAVHCLGVERARFQAIFESFVGLPHRLEAIAEIGKVKFVNDSKATNIEAASKALTAFEDVYWIAGGKGKSENFELLCEQVKNVRRAYLIGESAEEMKGALAGTIDCVKAETLERAVALAAKEAALCKGDRPVVLLSPACASFDQFGSFEARGDAFRVLAEDLSRKSDNVVEFPNSVDGDKATL